MREQTVEIKETVRQRLKNAYLMDDSKGSVDELALYKQICFVALSKILTKLENLTIVNHVGKCLFQSKTNSRRWINVKNTFSVKIY